MDKTKNDNYRNFSNRTSFNGQAIKADEELVPVVLSKEMAQTLKPAGLNYDNVETWTFRHGKKVPVVFIPNKKGNMESYMKIFNDDVERYLKHKDSILSDDLSLDEFLDNIDDEDIMLTVKALKEPYPKDIEGYENIRAKLLIEMRDTYFIDIEDVNNLNYFNDKLKERLLNNGFDLGKDIR